MAAAAHLLRLLLARPIWQLSERGAADGQDYEEGEGYREHSRSTVEVRLKPDTTTVRSGRTRTYGPLHSSLSVLHRYAEGINRVVKGHQIDLTGSGREPAAGERGDGLAARPELLARGRVERVED